MLRLLRPLLLLLVLIAVPAAARAVEGVHALKQFGTPLFGPDFTHFPQANPDAPKGGSIVLAEMGSFDSLNGIILRGERPRTLGLLSDTLMTGSGQELGAAYGLLAESVEVAPDKGSAIFHLRSEARWHDGMPVTAGDVVFAWEAIQAHGAPFLKSFLDRVTAVEALDDRRVAIRLKTTGEIKPIIDFALTMAPQPRHWWTAEGRDVSKTTLEPVLGSGPYRIKAVDPGRSISWERVAGYWGKDLPVNRGLYNFDAVKVDYYRDDDVMFEAFKGGAYDLRVENRAQRWVTGYEFPAAKSGRVERRSVVTELPLGAQGFRLNTRRAKLADPRVREALAWLFDFDWIQKNILYGQYLRTKSNFPNSDFGASGPPTPDVLALLEPFKDRIDPRVMTEEFDPPSTGGPPGILRQNLRRAQELFKEAGWDVKEGRLVNAATGEPFKLEFLDPGGSLVRVIQPYTENLRRAGVEASIRMVDSAQFQVRTDEFDFDVVVANFNFFVPPGTELRSYFGSEAAGVKGSANYSGVRDPVVDSLIDTVINARDLKDVQAATRALDRVLLWGWYMIPHWYNPANWLAYWTKFGWPAENAKYDLDFRNTHFPATWWYDAEKAARLTAK